MTEHFNLKLSQDLNVGNAYFSTTLYIVAYNGMHYMQRVMTGKFSNYMPFTKMMVRILKMRSTFLNEILHVQSIVNYM